MTLADPHVAAREAAAPVPMVQRPPQRRRDRPRSGPDFHHPPVRIVPHHHPARVARQPLRRSRGNVRAVFEHRLPRLLRRPPGPRRRRGPPPGTARLGRRDRARDAAPSPPAAPARPPAAAAGSGPPWPGRWSPRRLRWRGAAGTASRGPRRAPAGAARPPPASAARAAPPCRPRPGRRAAPGPRAGARPPGPRPAGPPGASPARCARRGRPCRPPHRQQARLGLRRRHAGQRADLGVGELAARQRLSQARQRPEGARHPDVLAGRARGESDAPGEPRGARAEAVVPTAAGVELADESRADGAVAASRCADSSAISSPRRSSSAMCGGVGCDGCNVAGKSGGRVSMASLPSSWDDSNPQSWERLRLPRSRERETSHDRSSPGARPRITRRKQTAGSPFFTRTRHTTRLPRNSVKRKIQKTPRPPGSSRAAVECVAPAGAAGSDADATGAR